MDGAPELVAGAGGNGAWDWAPWSGTTGMGRRLVLGGARAALVWDGALDLGRRGAGVPGDRAVGGRQRDSPEKGRGQRSHVS